MLIKANHMKIEVWSDIMCPFCYIGKRRLEKALASFENKDQVQVVWKSFLLNPDMVTDPSQSNLEYLANVKGWSLQQAQQITDQVTAMAAEEGLEYHLEKAVVANAKTAHRLLQLAKTLGKGDLMKERLLKAYFTEGANIDDRATLLSLAVEAGIEEQRASHCLDSDEFTQAVDEDIYESRLIGVSGVPFFVLDRKFGISGAQPIELFEQTLKKAWDAHVKAETSIEVANGPGESCDTDGNCN
jgi:predicted DsbA family dithiol-disulfide isomerase